MTGGWAIFSLLALELLPLVAALIGGTDTHIDEYPWLVQVYPVKNMQVRHCGGTLINTFHVLTAAHCVEENVKNPGAVIVTYGNTLRTSRVHVRKVKRIHLHTKFKTKLVRGNYISDYDVAVLLLDNPIVEDIVRIAPKSTYDVRAGRKLRLAGWGRTSKEGGPATRTLKTALFTVLSASICEKRLDGELTVSEFCVDETVQHAHCHGDSGGPAFDETTEMQYGVISWGKCGDNGAGVVADLTEPAVSDFVMPFTK